MSFPVNGNRSISFGIVAIAELEKEADLEATRTDEENANDEQLKLKNRIFTRLATGNSPLSIFERNISAGATLCTAPDWSQLPLLIIPYSPQKMRPSSPIAGTHQVSSQDDITLNSSSSKAPSHAKKNNSSHTPKFPNIDPEWIEMAKVPFLLADPRITCDSPTQRVPPTHSLEDPMTTGPSFDHLIFSDLTTFIQEKEAIPNLSKQAISELKILKEFLKNEKNENYNNRTERKIAYFTVIRTLIFSKAFTTKAKIFLASRLYIYGWNNNILVNGFGEPRKTYDFMQKWLCCVSDIRDFAKNLTFGSYAPYDMFFPYKKIFKDLATEFQSLLIELQKQESRPEAVFFSQSNTFNTSKNPNKDKRDPFCESQIKLPDSFDHQETGTPSSSSAISSSFRSISRQPTFTLVDISTKQPQPEKLDQRTAVQAFSCSASFTNLPPASHSQIQNTAVISNKKDERSGVRV
jgi:hypothetical protein